MWENRGGLHFAKWTSHLTMKRAGKPQTYHMSEREVYSNKPLSATFPLEHRRNWLEKVIALPLSVRFNVMPKPFDNNVYSNVPPGQKKIPYNHISRVRIRRPYNHTNRPFNGCNGECSSTVGAE